MILDHIENIHINQGVSPLTNFHSIPQLLEGIFMTYNDMNDLEKNYWERRYPNESKEKIEIYKKASFSIGGELSQVDAQGVNLFHWYSINVINYAKCCGLVSFLSKNPIQPEQIMGDKKLIAELRLFQENYIKSIPELVPVLHFRNKASAHLAFTDPKHYDNSATLIESMSIIPTLIQGKLKVGVMTRKRGEHESSFSKHPWSLTENFESLIPRFFKDYFD